MDTDQNKSSDSENEDLKNEMKKEIEKLSGLSNMHSDLEINSPTPVPPANKAREDSQEEKVVVPPPIPTPPSFVKTTPTPPEVPPQAPPAPEPVQFSKRDIPTPKKDPSRGIHTYTTDLQNTVRKEGAGLTRMAIKEEDRFRQERERKEKRRKTNMVTAIVSIFILLFAFVIFGYFYLFNTNKTEQAILRDIFPAPLIFSDGSEIFELTELDPRDAQEALLRVAEQNDVGEKDFILNFNFYDRTFTDNGQEVSFNVVRGRDLMRRLGIIHPDNLNLFIKDGMFGIYYDDMPHGFFVFKHDSYQRMFAEFLGWEKELEHKNLDNELYPILALGRERPKAKPELDPVSEPIIPKSSPTTTDPLATTTDPLATTTETVTQNNDSATSTNETSTSTTSSATSTTNSVGFLDTLPDPRATQFVDGLLEFINPPQKPSGWNDEVVQNIDIRTLRNESGDLIMLYSFLGSRDTLVITEDIETFIEIKTRFQTPEIIR